MGVGEKAFYQLCGLRQPSSDPENPSVKGAGLCLPSLP